MYDNREAPVCPARIHALVADMPSVQRVLTLLTGRNYPLTRFEAEEAGGGRWRLRIETMAAEDGQVELLVTRLQRLVSVLVVSTESSGPSSSSEQDMVLDSATA
jgi:hypothetical protein